MFRLLVILIISLFLPGCAHVSKDGRTFYGWGKAKRDTQGNILEIENTGFLKDIVSINAIN